MVRYTTCLKCVQIIVQLIQLSRAYLTLVRKNMRICRTLLYACHQILSGLNFVSFNKTPEIKWKYLLRFFQLYPTHFRPPFTIIITFTNPIYSLVYQCCVFNVDLNLKYNMKIDEFLCVFCARYWH